MNKDLRCPHCGEVLPYKTFTKWRYSGIYKLEKPDEEGIDAFAVSHNLCQVARCGELVVIRQYGKYTVGRDEVGEEFTDIEIGPSRAPEILYPRCVCNRQKDAAIPEGYRKDFEEACAVLSVSPKASAALSRRLLQKVIRGEHNIRKGNLKLEIEAFILKYPQPELQALQNFREIGNLAAHSDSSMILEVEEGEANWMLDMLEVTFQYTFVVPANTKTIQSKYPVK